MDDAIAPFLTLLGTVAAALLGLLIRKMVRADLLDKETRDVIGVSAVFILTFSSVVLGIVMAQSAARYTERRSQIDQIGSHISIIDQMLRLYEPNNSDLRKELRIATSNIADVLWDENTLTPAEKKKKSDEVMAFYEKIVHMPAESNVKIVLKTNLLESIHEVGRLRQMLLSEAADQSINIMLTGCIFWFFLNFLFYFILAPFNRIAITVLALCSIAVSFFVYIVREHEFMSTGFIQVAKSQITDVLTPLDK
ncbi:MAG: hypothetical protein FGM26_04330 [Beijerinckiaceae bacterium]|nr:hypothetical protein [Beijerinckiaceae bacterium]